MTTTPLPPGAERRRQLRQQRRQERLRHLWRLLVFTALAGGIGYLLLRQGWTVRSAAQVEVSGSSQVSRDQVIKAAGLRFPLPLLGLHPSQLDDSLRAALPIEQVRVTRLMLPPRLRIELVDRKAVARAERHTPQGLESGFVDRYGYWIVNRQDQGVRIKGDLSMRVRGWNERYRSALHQVLEARGRMGSSLREVRFDPEGSLWLEVAGLGPIRLGPADDQLPRRLEVLQSLLTSLPGQLKGRQPGMIDLSDPDQPELSLAGAGVPDAGLQPITTVNTSPATAGAAHPSGAAAPNPNPRPSGVPGQPH